MSQAAVLGLSATNIRYLDNQRDMADELFDGNIASEMTLGEAVVRGMRAYLSSRSTPVKMTWNAISPV
ncbi:MAG: hypothetical protein ACLUEQ_08455 [Cloacibacillus evryensis]